ncbi:metal-dependent hydrolase, partial [Mesorhizobium sp. M2A.F.Ca.ET.037.01.1.1]
IHLHDRGTLGLFEIEEIVARATASGMQGKVAVSHAYALGDISADALARAGERIAAAGVSIMTNAPGDHAFPPVAALRKAGVTVFAGSDNIRDSWWPYGDGDMLNRANMIGYRSGFYEDRELETAYDVVSHAGAKALGLEGYGIAVVAKADFVALRAEHVPEAVVAVPKDRTVYRAGKEVARNGKVTA